MNMKLTQRDKKLLAVISFLLVVVVFGRFVVMPQLERHTTLVEETNEAQMEQQTMESTIASASSLQTSLKQSEKETKKATEDLYNLMESHEAERTVTNIILEAGMASRDFQINTTPYICTPVGYVNSTYYLEQMTDSEDGSAPVASSGGTFNLGAQDAAVSEEGDSSEEGADQEAALETASGIYGYTISFTADGTVDSMKKLIDTLYRDYPGIRVINYEISYNDLASDAGKKVSVSTVNVMLEFYMCEKG